jgi:cell division inhibitor SepF
MAGALRKTMVYLGLAEEDERYGAYDVEHDGDYEAPDDVDERDDNAFAGDRAHADRHHEARELHERELHPTDRTERRAAVTPISRGQVARMVPAPAPAELHRISTIHPRTYNEAKTIGESFRGGTPVIMNLTDMDDSDAKRLVDFAAGLVFGLHGTIERVTSKVFLLSPANVEVAPADKPRSVPERGFFNQS